MPKTEWNLGNILKAVSIAIVLIGGGIGGGITGTLAWGAVKSDVKRNKDDIVVMKAADEKLATAVHNLELTIRDLTATIKHEHGGE